MISTGKKIDPSVKIKQWSAKYMNGTNILGRGSRYVLSNDATGRYYQVTDNGIFLPKPLTDQGGKTGFYYDGKGMPTLIIVVSKIMPSLNMLEITITSIKKVIVNWSSRYRW